jgi:DNA-binding MarR family transcriptional regulator
MTDPPSDGYSLLFDVFVLGQRVRHLMAIGLADAPLRSEEYAVYSVVFEEEAVTPTAMAATLSMPLTTVADYVRLMESRGHVRRIANPRDRRSYLLVLTASGRKAHRDTNRAFERVHAAFSSAIPGGERAVRRELAKLLSAAEHASLELADART